MKIRSFVFIILFVLLIYFSLVSFWKEPFYGDSTRYLALADEIKTSGLSSITKSTNGELTIFDLFPILPLVLSGVMIFNSNYLINARIFNFIIQLLLLFVIYRYVSNKNKKNAPLAVIFTAFNPFLFYYFSSIFMLTEPIAMLLMYGGIYYLMEKKKRTIGILLLSISILARYSIIFFLAPFLVLLLLHEFVIKKEKSSLLNLLVFIPFLVWMIVLKVFAGSAGKVYTFSSDSIMSIISNSFSYLFVYSVISASMILFVIYILSSLALPKFIRKIKKEGLKKIVSHKTEDVILVCSSVAYIVITPLVMLIFNTVPVDYNISYFISRTRYLLPVLPALTIVFFRNVNISKMVISKRLVRMTITLLIVFSIFFSLFLTHGGIQNAVSNHIKIPQTFSARNYDRGEAISFFEDNYVDQDVGIFYIEREGMSGDANLLKYYVPKNNYIEENYSYAIYDQHSNMTSSCIETIFSSSSNFAKVCKTN